MAPVAVDFNVAAFVEDELGIAEQAEVILDHPSGAECAAGFLVCRAQEDDVAFEPHPTAMQQKHRHGIGDADALAVEGTASVHVAIANDAGERRHFPFACRGRDDVEMAQ